MEFYGTNQTPFLVLSNIIVLVFLFLLLRPALQNSKSISNKRIILVEIIIFIFCLFSFWGTDWYGYLSYFTSIKKGLGYNIPVEKIYIWLFKKLPSYLSFRLIVWGAALLLLKKTIRNLDINKGLFLFFFCSISLIWFAYARASLAMAFLFCGLSYISNEHKYLGKRYIYKLIGLILICVSFYFHKSAVIGIAAIALAIIFRKIGGQKGFLLMLISFPIMVLIAKGLFVDVFSDIVSDDTNMLHEYALSGSVHFESETLRQGIGILIEQILECIPGYLLIVICYEVLSSKKDIPRNIELVMYSLCSIILVASIFVFDLGSDTNIIYGRMMRYSQIPMCICFTYFYERGFYPKQVKWTYSVGIIGCFYAITYMLYNVVLG